MRPSVKQEFTRDQTLGIYMQVYNLGINPETRKPQADIQYAITRDGKPFLNQTEDAAKIRNASQQLTLQKTMPLKALEPGKYKVQITVTDNVKNQTLSPRPLLNCARNSGTSPGRTPDSMIERCTKNI